MKRNVLVLALVSLFGGACTNPDVPAGHEGYIYYKPLLFGQMEYRDSLPGPASTSLSWRLFTTNIDMRERTYAENFKLLTHDDLQITFEVNTRIRLRTGTVKEIVEQWGGPNWYEWNVKEPMRTIIRTEITTIDAAKIQLETNRVSVRIKELLTAKYKDTPFEFMSVDIGRFGFPPRVDEAIQAKIAKQQELEQQQYLLDTAKKQAAIDVIQALQVNKRQRIIGESLDPLYVQWRAVQVYRKLAAASNDTVIMLPSTTEGTAIPKILSRGQQRKLMTAEDERELEEIEAYYRQQVQESTGASTSQPAPQ